MKYDTATPFIASYLIFLKDDAIAFLLRGNTGYADNMYGLPSGKVEAGESYVEAAIREAKEEVGVDIQAQNLDPVLTVHRKGEDGTYWVDVFFAVTQWDGELSNAEPDKHRTLEWFSPEHFPDSIIPSVRYSLQQIGMNQHYAEFGWKV